ncbi:uncharacterized protein N7511_000802 [Penicillium nucicola]|uniref:uncharacterized protein n=1 Tax=Penicillium nucicola TaxID=1850975 RepID=UPI0025454EEF|nr:uncharacterized protein N7511_000802 [Penicillium nucicola]KAJ5775791.1 hypothetical protein N7511_000802 [Penicillium nucicola]
MRVIGRGSNTLVVNLAGGWDVLIVDERQVYPKLTCRLPLFLQIAQEVLGLRRLSSYFSAMHLLVPLGTLRHVDSFQTVIIQATQTFDSLPFAIKKVLEGLGLDEKVAITILADTIKLIQLFLGIVLSEITRDILCLDNEDLIQLPATADSKHIELLGDSVQALKVLSPILLNVVGESTSLQQLHPAIRFINRPLLQGIVNDMVTPLPDSVSCGVLDLLQTSL